MIIFMRLGEGLLVLGAALTNLSGTPIEKAPQTPRAEQSVDSSCSPERIRNMRDDFLGEYTISEIDGSIALLPRRDADRYFVFDVYQRFADMHNWYDGVLACYRGPAGSRVLAPECNIVISPCQKAALKEAAEK